MCITNLNIPRLYGPCLMKMTQFQSNAAASHEYNQRAAYRIYFRMKESHTFRWVWSEGGAYCMRNSEVVKLLQKVVVVLFNQNLVFTEVCAVCLLSLDICSCILGITVSNF